MDNKTALFLALLVIFGLALDQVFQNGVARIFLAGKLVGLIDYMAFWR